MVYESTIGCEIFFFFLGIKSRLCKYFNENNKSSKVGCGGQDLSFCVRLKTPFTSKSTFEEEETFEKTP